MSECYGCQTDAALTTWLREMRQDGYDEGFDSRSFGACVVCGASYGVPAFMRQRRPAKPTTYWTTYRDAPSFEEQERLAMYWDA